jgi:RHS repeat-associated protein
VKPHKKYIDMKNIILTLSAFLLIGASGAQILIDKEIPGNITKIITAPEYIRMMPGFEYKPVSQNYFRAYIDENASTILPVTYQEYIDPEKRELDFDLPVGSTDGVASVSLTGAATYTIPIFSPPGTAGMQPSLSLAYSSQAGNGIAGYGWNLAGLSAITRTGLTIYHDDRVEGIDFDDDRFALDGQRLIKSFKSEQYGADGTRYFTEIFNGSRIISHGSIGNGPAWFKVIGNDGSIIEYGKTNNSRLTSQRPDQTTITWYINKITDPNGNYIQFIYDKKALEINIKEIKYTGNDEASPAIEPYNSIKFYYSDRTDNSTAFVSGSRLEQTLLLDHIDVVSEKNIVKSYILKYFYDFYSKLNEVEEFGSDGAHYNSIVFGYDNSVYSNSVNNTKLSSKDNIIMFVDFNNDGLADIFKGGSSGTNEKSWEIHINQGEDPRFNNEPDFSGNLLNSRDHKIVPIDFDGDGFMDILIYSIYSSVLFGDEYCDLDLLHNTGSDFVTYHLLDESDLHGWWFDNFNTEIRVLDMDGDNKDEFILWISGEWMGSLDHLVYFFEIQQTNNTIVANNLFFKEYLYSGFQPTNILALDLNGDSKDELLIVKEDDKSEIYEFIKENNVIHSRKIYDSGFPSSHHHLFVGDFNGDGRVDLLSQVQDNQHKTHWYLAYWLDGGFVENEIIDILPENNDPTFYSVGDFNGDGKADLSYLYNENINGNYRARNKIFYSYNDSFKSSTNELFMYFIGGSSNWQVPPQPFSSYLSDFDGDGISDLGFGAADFIRCVITKPWVNYNTLKMVANGFNAKSQFLYNTLASQSIYSTNGQLDYPVRHFVYPLKVVESLATDNGLGDFNTLTYNYGNGIVHLEGKGFLGFQKFQTTSSISPVRSTSMFAIHPTYYFLQPEQTFSYKSILGPDVQIHRTNSVNQVKTGFELTNKVFLPWQSLVTEKDYTTGNKKTTELTIDNYGNPLTQEVKIFESHSATTETASNLSEYQDYWSAPGNIPSKPQTIVSTAKRYGQLPLSKTNKITYDSKGNTTSTIDFFGMPKAVTTIYSDFTVVGLPKTSTVSATDMQSRISRVVFDSKYRFVTSQTDAEGYTSSTIYEPAFGNKLSVTSANEQTISMEYDGFGTPIRQTDDLGVWSKTEFRWYTGSTKPNVLYFAESTSNNGLTSAKYFDKLGRALYATRTDPNEMISSTKTVYNYKGEVISISEPYFEGTTPTQFTTTTYHSYYGFPVSTKLPTGVIITNTAPTPENPGRTTTVTNSATGITTSKKADCTGKLITAIDPGGTLTYTYYSDGQTKQIDSPDGNNVSITYDEYGRQKTLNDPDAGVIEYIHDAFGQLIYQKDANGSEFDMHYDKLGRLLEKETIKNNLITNQVFKYYPFDTEKGRRGAIDYAHYADENGNNTRETYLYNDKAQLTQKNIVTDNNNRTFSYFYTYDSKGNPDEYTYPSGFTIKNEYKPDNGTLKKVIDKSTNTAIYEPGTYNARGQMMHFAMNNKSLYTTFGYDDYGLPTYRMTGNYYPTSTNIQYLETNFDSETGNLTWRKDRKRNLTEFFTYDPVHKNRLASWQVQGQQPYSSTYNNANGNILTKTDFTSYGNPYSYGLNAGPHAVTGVTAPLLMPAEAQQEIQYNSFNKASLISHNYQRRELFLHYGPDEQRIKTEYKINGQPTLTRYFPGGGLEVEVSANGSERWLHYLPGGGLYVCDKEFNKIGMYYVLTDYLGSWDKVISETGSPIEEYSFDPWGRRRNPVNWTYSGVPSSFIFDRGYTGHEMLDAFGLVNMNGRMYDPVLGRMLSPDNYVSSPGSTQAFNRYSYALNNPLIITDPSGEHPALIAMIAYSAIVGGLSSAKNGDGFLQGFGTGVATGALSYGVGAAIGPVVSGSTVWANMANAGIHTAIAGGMTYGVDALVNNTAFNWKAYGLNIATSMALAGLSYQKPGAQYTYYSLADLEGAGIPSKLGSGYGMRLDNPPGKDKPIGPIELSGAEIISTRVGETWYYGVQRDGVGDVGHSLVRTVGGIIFEINHPDYGRTRGFKSWINGGPKAVGYRYDMSRDADQSAFWSFGDGRDMITWQSVNISNPQAATAFYESWVGQSWDYNFFTNNCKHYISQGLSLGGASINFSTHVPTEWPGAYVTPWYNPY